MINRKAKQVNGIITFCQAMCSKICASISRRCCKKQTTTR